MASTPRPAPQRGSLHCPGPAQDLPWLQPFFAQTTPGAWCLVDLRPARRALLAHELQATGQLQTALLGYDYLVIIPETTANGPF